MWGWAVQVRRRTLPLAVLATALAVTLAACGGNPEPEPVPPPGGSPVAVAPHGPLPPKHGAYIGASVKPERRTQEGRIEAIEEFQRLTGRALDVVHTFHPWHDDFPDDVDRYVLASGQLPLMGWAGSDCPGIASGRYDELIRQRAQAVRQLGRPVFLAFRWEMDRPNLRDQVGSPADYIAAWKHVRAIFDQVGATNVSWVWAPSAKGFTRGYAAPYYPGDDQVDWIGADAYTGPTLRPFGEVVARFMDFAAQHPDKPVMIAEFGLSDRDGQRPAWLRQARAYVRQHPQIGAMVYFNGGDKAYARAQLSVTSSASGRQAFHDWLADPYFNADDRPVEPPQ